MEIRMFNKKGFTLVELMIVVAIIGILAAIAIPNFVDMQYRAKRAEVPSNVDGIKTAQIAYDAAFDTYVEISAYKPSSTVGKTQIAWSTGTDFDTLGWGPDGKVRGAYKVTSKSSTDFLVMGICDVDGDGVPTNFTATKSINTTMNTGASIY
jgi:type IV pilus assembly protein PilA